MVGALCNVNATSADSVERDTAYFARSLANDRTAQRGARARRYLALDSDNTSPRICVNASWSVGEWHPSRYPIYLDRNYRAHRYARAMRGSHRDMRAIG